MPRDFVRRLGTGGKGVGWRGERENGEGLGEVSQYGYVGSLDDGEEFDIEIEGGSAWDDSTCAFVAVAEFCGDDKLPPASDFHVEKSFVPGRREGGIVVRGGVDMVSVGLVVCCFSIAVGFYHPLIT